MGKRFGKYVFALFTVLVMIGSAACADYDMLSTVAAQTGSRIPESAAALVQKDLYQATVNGVEITVREAAYDGRSLFLQYSFRMPDVDHPLGLTAAEAYGDELPEGLNPDEYVFSLADDWEEQLYMHNIGWWIDDIWFDGKPMPDMPDGSGQFVTGTGVPGELIETDIWRLDNLDIFLDGKVQISLPIGSRQDLTDYYEDPGKYGDDGLMLLPQDGMITFEFDAGDIHSSVRTFRPEAETVVPVAAVRVTETVFSPMMTYIYLDLAVNPDAMAAFLAENGEGVTDEDGEIIWPYSDMDVFGEWLDSLQLTDAGGAVLFPDIWGPAAYSDTGAEFLLPYLETVPGALYLAPVSEDGVADMSLAVPVI